MNLRARRVLWDNSAQDLSLFFVDETLVWLAKTTLPVSREPGLGVLALDYDPVSSYASGFWNLGAIPEEDFFFWAVDSWLKTEGYYFSGQTRGPPSHQATAALPSKKLEVSSPGSSIRDSRSVVEIRAVKQRGRGPEFSTTYLFVDSNINHRCKHCWQ